MIIPGQEFTILDPGLPAAVPGIAGALVLGTSSAGTVDTLYSFTNPKDVVDTLGQGELPEDLCHILAIAGGVVYAVKLAGGVAATVSAVAHAGAGAGTVVLSGTPFDGYALKVLITKGGLPGEAEFSYSLDGVTYSDVMVVPSGGAFTGIAAVTGLTLTFALTFAAGDEYSADCTAPYYTPTNLADGMAAVLDSGVEFAFLQLAGEASASASAKLMAAALDVHVVSLFNQARFVRAMLATGKSDKPTSIADYASFGSKNVAGVFGRMTVMSSKPLAGWSVIDRPFVNAVAARAARSLISTDLGRVNDGPLPGVVAISHDEARTPMMDAKRFTTSRTVQGRAGFFITNCRLMSPPGSDYRYWQHGRCMDAACRVAWLAQSGWIGGSVRTVGTGTIDPRDAARLEGPVRTSLADELTGPETAEGTPGHVTAVSYAIDRSSNVSSTDALKTTVGIKPRAYTKFIYTQLSYSLTAGA